MDKYQEEWEAVMRWANKEIDRITEDLKQSGQYKPGLDANSAAYVDLWNEVWRRAQAIQRKAEKAKRK